MEQTRRGFFGTLLAGLAALRMPRRRPASIRWLKPYTIKTEDAYDFKFTGFKPALEASQYAPTVGGAYRPGEHMQAYRMTVTTGPSGGGYWDDVKRHWVQWTEDADGNVTGRWEGNRRVL